ncbi:MAG: hypothetical protein HY928_02960 [Elusimicrobia bacterium]|nr:hypothetical protein [Elusimicrobiota bacterium]
MSAAAALAVGLATGTVFSTTGFSEPESALWDPGAKAFYVSNIAGRPDGKDGKGWLTRLDELGRISNPSWVSGLNAPKGLALSRGRLYAADIDLVAVIDPDAGKVITRIPVPGAVFLNDVAAAPDGSLFVSDSVGGAIYRISPDGKAQEWAKGDWLENPNGLSVRGGRLYVAPWGLKVVPGRLYWLDIRTKKRYDVSPSPLGRLDGLEPASGGGWLVTDAEKGRLYRVDSDGSATVLKEGLKGPADLGYDAKRRWIVVPLLGEDLVEGYDQTKLPVPPPGRPF